MPAVPAVSPSNRAGPTEPGEPSLWNRARRTACGEQRRTEQRRTACGARDELSRVEQRRTACGEQRRTAECAEKLKRWNRKRRVLRNVEDEGSEEVREAE